MEVGGALRISQNRSKGTENTQQHKRWGGEWVAHSSNHITKPIWWEHCCCDQWNCCLWILYAATVPTPQKLSMPAAAPTLPLEWIFRPLLLWVTSPGFKVWGDYVWLEDTSPYLVANEAGETIILCFLTLYKALPSTKTQEVSQYKEENQRWEMASCGHKVPQ